MRPTPTTRFAALASPPPPSDGLDVLRRYQITLERRAAFVRSIAPDVIRTLGLVQSVDEVVVALLDAGPFAGEPGGWLGFERAIAEAVVGAFERELAARGEA